jgi:hypothetical protein
MHRVNQGNAVVHGCWRHLSLLRIMIKILCRCGFARGTLIFRRKRHSTSSELLTRTAWFLFLVAYNDFSEGGMIDKVREILEQYHDQFMTWYDGLETAVQYGVIVAIGFVVFLILIFIFLHKITR